MGIVGEGVAGEIPVGFLREGGGDPVGYVYYNECAGLEVENC